MSCRGVINEMRWTRVGTWMMPCDRAGRSVELRKESPSAVPLPLDFFTGRFAFAPTSVPWSTFLQVHWNTLDESTWPLRPLVRGAGGAAEAAATVKPFHAVLTFEANPYL